MTDRTTAASVRQRLLSRAKADGVEFEYMLVRYANERLLCRLGCSAYREMYALKGATLFATWAAEVHRPTRDIDLLGFGDPDMRRLEEEFREIAAQPVEADGIVFPPDSLAGERIREGQRYEGVRVSLIAELGSARVTVQVDVGFGDATEPGLRDETLPTLLDLPAPRVRAYRPETVVAEKLQAMVELGIANSRMKDFYDVYLMARTMTFGGRDLSAAVRATFERRATRIPRSLPTALTDEFATDAAKTAQWRAFARRTGASDVPPLEQVVEELRGFLSPVLERADGAMEDAVWRPGRGWE